MAQAISSSSPVVLVVEDEPILRMVAVEMVHDAGLDAVEAANAQEALEILEGRDDIRVVFTDVHMPGKMNGMNLAKCVRDRWPPIEIIITSGLMKPEAVPLPNRGVFVAKPYDAGRVTSLLRQMVA